VIGVERFSNPDRGLFMVTLGAPEFMESFPCYMTEEQLLQVVDVAMLMRVRRVVSCIQRQWRSYRQRRRAWALKVIEGHACRPGWLFYKRAAARHAAACKNLS
jgi:hypothetical protein